MHVVIVGYGPVGQTLAILLAQYGWRVTVLEKQPAPYPLPRAVHFDHEIARILQAVDGIEGLLPTLEPADVYEWRNGKGDVLLRLPSRQMGLCGWPDANMFTQPELERLLQSNVQAMPGVDVRRGVEVVGVVDGDDGATVTMRMADGSTATLAARFVIGCDGSNSLVRSQVGATVTDLGFFFDWLIVDVLPHEPTVWQPLNVQICDPARPTTMVSGGRGRRRWEFMALPGEDIATLNNVDTAWRLLAPWNVTPSDATLERHAVYRFQARWVDRWRHGHVLLAGDAAHQMPPFAGQGLCAGLRDAMNLAWKLDRVLGGRSEMALLDAYAEERIPHVRMMIELSMALGRVICVPDPAEAAARDASMMAALETGGAIAPPPPGITGGVLRADDALAGQLFVQGPVEHGGRRGLFDDVVGRGWTLVSVIGDPHELLDAETAAWFASLGGVTAHVGGDAPVRDVDGRYARWFADAGVAVVLQRPDFYVFGAAPTLDGVRALVQALRARLG